MPTSSEDLRPPITLKVSDETLQKLCNAASACTLQAVLKLSDVHHADVTAKEWVYGSKTLDGNGAAAQRTWGRPPFFRILDEYLSMCDPFAIDNKKFTK